MRGPLFPEKPREREHLGLYLPEAPVRKTDFQPRGAVQQLFDRPAPSTHDMMRNAL
jgi:hypothetical protein